jgi:hypothetical protein
MSKKIKNPAKCELRAVIQFLNAQNVRPIETYRQLIAVYGEGVMNESNARKWCRMFNKGRTNVQDEDLKNRIDQHIRPSTSEFYNLISVLFMEHTTF